MAKNDALSGNDDVDPDTDVMKNTDTGPANGVLTEDNVLKSELYLETMTAEDEAILGALRKARISTKRAADALRLLRGTISEKRFEAVADDVQRFGFRVSTPALVRYLLDKRADSDHAVRGLIEDARDGLRRVSNAYIEIDEEERQIAKDTIARE